MTVYILKMGEETIIILSTENEFSMYENIKSNNNDNLHDKIIITHSPMDSDNLE